MDEEGVGPESGPGSGEGTSDAPERLAFLINLLSDDNEGARWKAAEALGRLGDPGAVDALIDTLWDDDPRVRLKVAWALGRIGDSRAIPHLRRLYRMEREDVREIIKEALETINRKQFSPDDTGNADFQENFRAGESF